MTRVVWTARAWERLLEIETFIAENSPVAAAKLVDRLIARAESLADHPDRGRRVPEMPRSGLRDLVVGNYRVVYRHRPRVIEVLTIFEGHRRLRHEELEDD